MSVYLGEIETFPNIKADKAQVLKIGEECMEVFSAWENNDQCDDWLNCSNCQEAGTCSAFKHLTDECADVVQSVANLAAALGIRNFTLFVEACERRNRKRGRYAS